MVRSPSVDKNGLTRSAWSEEEDNKLKAYVQRYGHWNWRQLPKFAGLARCGKSCRLRWMNYLRPGLKKGSYTKEEEEMIIKLREELGNRWSAIAAKLPGRTDNEIKNYWNSHLKKRRRQDPKAKEKAKERSEIMQVMEQREKQDVSVSVLESTNRRKMELAADLATADSSAEEISSPSHSTILCGEENSFTSKESFPNFFESFWTEPFFTSTSYRQIPPPTSYSSGLVDLEDWVTENGISLEESFIKSFQTLSTEPVSSNASDSLISPSTSCLSTISNSGESFPDVLRSSSTEPVCSNPSTDQISPSLSCNSTVTNWTGQVFTDPPNKLVLPSKSYHSATRNSEEASADAFGDFWTEPCPVNASYYQSIHQFQPAEQGVMFPFTSFFEYDLDDTFNQFGVLNNHRG